MPRLPDPKSKTPQLTVRAINDKDDENFRKLKEICKEKGVTLASKLRPAIYKIVKDEWPPNPQLQMGQFNGRLPLSPETLRKLQLSPNQVWEKCPVCEGSKKDCAACRGTGRVPVDRAP